MSDHRNHRHRASEPAWPTGEDPKPRASAQQPDRTGFWSPLWEDDDDDDVPSARAGNGHGRRAQSNGGPNGGAGPNGHGRHGSNGHANGANGHARKGGDAGAHAWPEAEPPAAPRHAEPPAPPRPTARRGATPAWPSGEEPSPTRRAGGPHTPPPPGAGGRPPAGQTTRVVRPRPAGPPRPGAPGPGRPGPDPNGPTEVMQPAHRSVGPEPNLLTHREPDYDEDLNDDPDLDYDEDDDRPLSEEDRKLRRKKVWKRVRRTMYVLTALGIIAPIVAFFVAYQMVEVPTPESVAASQEQVVTLMYADGTTKLSSIVPEDGTRQFVKYDQLPDVVKNAVFAAEDAEFMTNPGFDITGVMRAGWNQVSGGTGGGSTITQQYIKMATGNDEASGIGGYSRKGLEVVKAYKMNKTFSKQEILEAYLNTIYFGRSANGIVAAAAAYYGKALKDLTPSEAALLAGMIQGPGKYKDQAYMERRWKFVMDQMLDKGWISATERQASAFPAMIPLEQARPTAIEGPRAHIQRAVMDEVEEETGLSLAQLKQRGYTIITTIDPNAQTLAEQAVDSVMAGQPTNILPALVAVEPTTGEVKAYYGGVNGNGLDWAKQRQEPGSSFKPFDLVALLEKGKGLGETYDGTSGRQFTPGGPKIRNSGGDSCGEKCTVALAMKKSINTVFYDIALNTVGTKAVANAAHQAGITSPLEGTGADKAPDGNIAIGGGTTQVSTLEMASAYATFAANGIYHKPHLVKQIKTPDGDIFWEPSQATKDGKAAFDQSDAANNAKIARNVTESLLPIPKSSNIACANNRACAGKTGTHQLGESENNAKAWMVGYTPQISTAVSMGAEENNKQMPLMNNKGKIVYGSGLPGKIWQTFMNSYLNSQPKMTFGKFTPIGKTVEEAENEGKKDDDNKASNTQQTQTDNQQTRGNENTQTSDPEEPGTGNTSTDPEQPGTGNNCIPPLCNNNNDDDN